MPHRFCTNYCRTMDGRRTVAHIPGELGVASKQFRPGELRCCSTRALFTLSPQSYCSYQKSYTLHLAHDDLTLPTLWNIQLQVQATKSHCSQNSFVTHFLFFNNPRILTTCHTAVCLGLHVPSLHAPFATTSCRACTPSP